jgi:hypothetical protein
MSYRVLFKGFVISPNGYHVDAMPALNNYPMSNSDKIMVLKLADLVSYALKQWLEDFPASHVDTYGVVPVDHNACAQNLVAFEIFRKRDFIHSFLWFYDLHCKQKHVWSYHGVVFVTALFPGSVYFGSVGMVRMTAEHGGQDKRTLTHSSAEVIQVPAADELFRMVLVAGGPTIYELDIAVFLSTQSNLK